MSSNISDRQRARARKKARLIKERRRMVLRTHFRTMVAFGVVVVALLGLSIKVFSINYTHGDEYSQAVLDHQSYTSTTLPYRRGQIVSSDGTVLAYSEKVYNLILDVKQLKKQQEDDPEYMNNTLNALTKCFKLERSYLEEQIRDYPTSQYQKLLRELSANEIYEFNQLKEDSNNKIAGVWFEEAYIRKYPFGVLACDVIGLSSNVEGGGLGIERQYDTELKGTDGTSYSYVDEGLEVSQSTKFAKDGNNIITTLDYNVQAIIEKHLIAYNKEKPSLNTGVVVMNPNNGEVIGMASYPNFDLNNPRDLSAYYSAEELSAMEDKDVSKALYTIWENFCVSGSYEPGSTFKPITVASSLEEGVIKDGDTYECKGSVTIGPDTLKCHVSSSIGSHGMLTLEQSIMESCNPYMINLASKLGAVRFAQYQKMFGFGSKSGIDLPDEYPGLLYSEDKIREIDAACNSFGQNLNVNMVQMLSAYSSLINGGYYYQPHVVRRIESPEGEVIKENTPLLVRQTVTASTSKYLNRYLKSTVDTGTAARAGIEGYSIAGKTGTAQKGDRSQLKWVISFIGHAPADNPKFAIYVVIDEAYGTTGTAGSTADVLKLTKEIMGDLLPYMSVYKDTDAPYVDPADKPVENGVTEVPEYTAGNNGNNASSTANTNTSGNGGGNTGNNSTNR